MTLKQINQFETDDPEKLGRQLSNFEDNVHAECESIRQSFEAFPAVVLNTFLPAPKSTIFPLAADQQASFDTLLGSVTAILPPLRAANFGRRFIVLKRYAANTVSVSCQDPAVKLNAAAFPLAITAAGVTVFCCDQAGYYK